VLAPHEDAADNLTADGGYPHADADRFPAAFVECVARRIAATVGFH